ncbi:MAG: hypothetical protein R2788_21305 [Saprospiraceae bacterium]
MKEIILGIIISLFTLFLISLFIERGDINAMSMYFVVFLIPVLIIPIVNGLVLMKIEVSSIDIKFKRIISVAPMIPLAILTMLNGVRIPSIDGDISLIGIVGTLVVCLTNLIWNYRLKK